MELIANDGLLDIVNGRKWALDESFRSALRRISVVESSPNLVVPFPIIPLVPLLPNASADGTPPPWPGSTKDKANEIKPATIKMIKVGSCRGKCGII